MLYAFLTGSSCLNSTVGEQDNEKRVLKLFVRPSQDHKYVVSAEVLHESWPMDGSELTFVQKLSESRRNETRGRVMKHHTVSYSQSWVP